MLCCVILCCNTFSSCHVILIHYEMKCKAVWIYTHTINVNIGVHVHTLSFMYKMKESEQKVINSRLKYRKIEENEIGSKRW